MRVDPGELKYTIQLIAPGRTTDGNGHYISAETGVSVRAGVRSVRAGDVIEDGAARSQATIQFTIRWRSGVNADMTVLFNGSRYAIEQVDPVPFCGRYMRIRAVSYDAGTGDREV